MLHEVTMNEAMHRPGAAGRGRGRAAAGEAQLVYGDECSRAQDAMLAMAVGNEEPETMLAQQQAHGTMTAVDMAGAAHISCTAQWQE